MISRKKLSGGTMALLLVLMAVWGITQSAGAQSTSFNFNPVVTSTGECTVTVNAGESIVDAARAAPTGAVVCVRGGVYNEQIMLSNSYSGLTLKAFPGELPILDGQNVLPTAQWEGLIHVRSANSITIEGFEVRNSAQRGVVVGHTEGTSNPTYNVTVRNMIVHHNQQSGINVLGTASAYIENVLLEDNTIYENLQKNLNGDLGGSAVTFVSARNSVARGNVIYNNHGEGLVSDRWATNITFEDNITYDNDHANIYLVNTVNPLVQRNLVFCTDDRSFWNRANPGDPDSLVMKAGTGLQVRDEYFPGYSEQPPLSSGQVIINNLVVGCGTNFGVATQLAGGGLTNAIVANNSFINARGDGANGVNNVRMEGRATFANSQFVNNLVLQTTPGSILRMQYSLGTPDLSTFTVANNLYHTTQSWPDSWFPDEPGRVRQDPLLANPVLPVAGSVPDPAWYTPTAGSPAIGAGLTLSQVTEDFSQAPRSTPPDIGAFQYAAVANPGQILVTVAATPSGAEPLFSLTSNLPQSTFQLSSGQTYDSGPLDAGTYNVAMLPFPGWTLDSVTCSDGSAASAIALDDGETVTCTFAVSEQPLAGTIIVRKETDPEGSTEQFGFVTSYGDGFTLSDAQSNESADLAAGVYSVQENAATGWEQTSATCDDDSDPSAIDLAAGETVTCTFVNTQQKGTIVVRKETAPDGATKQFDFTSSFGAGFQLADGQSHSSDPLAAGIYSVEEAATDGWEQTSATCDDGSDPAAVDLAAGETVTCTFVNAQTQQTTGTIIVLKETEPNGATDQFTFTTDYSDDFQLSDGQSNTSAALAAGVYTVEETAVTGWEQTSATCDDGSEPAAIDLSAGETITCVFTNTQEPQTGSIVVRVQTAPVGAAQLFGFTTDYSSGFQLADGQSNTSEPLDAGNYAIQAQLPAGWTQTSSTCDDGSVPSAVSLSVGETVTCTFYNKEDDRSGSSEVLYISPLRKGTVTSNGTTIDYGIDDILAYDGATGAWSVYLDMSDVGIRRNLNGFTFLDDGSVLLTMNRNQSLNGVGLVTPKDIVRFTPTSTGTETAGTFQWYLDGSDVGLTTSGEVIDTLTLAPDGRLLISVTGAAVVKNQAGANIKARDEDLLVFNPTSLGLNSAGHWELYFDGSAVKGLGVEDVTGAWLDAANSDIYLTVSNSFNIGGVRGNAHDIIKLSPSGGNYQVEMYWRGPDYGFSGIANTFEFIR